MSVLREKEKIRKSILSIRRNQNPEEINLKSKLIAESLMIPGFLETRSVLLYAALRDEVQTGFAIERYLEMKKKVFLPKVTGEELKIYEITSCENDTAQGAYGIMEPIQEKLEEGKPESVDLAVVPGVAFDERGGRLGFGKGYYDRLLKRLPAKIPFVGLAFEFQITERVPVDENDIFLDFIVTEKRIINCYQNNNI